VAVDDRDRDRDGRARHLNHRSVLVARCTSPNPCARFKLAAIFRRSTRLFRRARLLRGAYVGLCMRATRIFTCASWRILEGAVVVVFVEGGDGCGGGDGDGDGDGGGGGGRRRRLCPPVKNRRLWCARVPHSTIVYSRWHYKLRYASAPFLM
jgi:hypothetical protein